MVDVTMTPATIEDGHELAADLRQLEADEIRAMTGLEPLPDIVRCLGYSSEAWAVRFDGHLVCLWGVVSRGHNVLMGWWGNGWLLCTNAVERYPITFWKACKHILPLLLSRWDLIANVIDVRHEQSMRWAERLGFRLEDPKPLGAAGLPFRRFTVRKEYLTWV